MSENITGQVSIIPEPIESETRFSPENQAAVDHLVEQVGGQPGMGYDQYQDYKRILSEELTSQETAVTMQMMSEGVDSDTAADAIAGIGQRDLDTIIPETAASNLMMDVEAVYGDYTDVQAQVAQEHAATYNYINQVIAEFQAERDDRWWVGTSTLSDLAVGINPLNQTEFYEDVYEGVTGKEWHWGKLKDFSPVIREIRDHIWSLPHDERMAALKNLKEVESGAELVPSLIMRQELWQNMNLYTGEDEQNAHASYIFDMVFLGAEAIPGIGIGPDAVKMLGRGLARRSPDTIAQATQSNPAVGAGSDVVMPITGNDTDPGVSAAQITVLDSEAGIINPEEFTQEELTGAVDFYEDKLKRELAHHDVSWEPGGFTSEIGDGWGKVRYDIGESPGEAFDSIEAAEDMAKFYGIPDPKIVPGNGNDGYFIRMSMDINPLDAGTYKVEEIKGRNSLVDFYLRNIGTSDYDQNMANLHAMRHLAVDYLTGAADTMHETFEPLRQSWKALGKQHSDIVTKIIKENWKEPNTLDGTLGITMSEQQFKREYRAFSTDRVEEAWKAYKSYIDLDETLYARNNDLMRKTLVRDGYQSVVLKEGDVMIGREVTEIPEGATIQTPDGKAVVDWEEEILSGGRAFYDLVDDKYIVTRQATLSELPQNVLNRTYGGRMDYSDNAGFIKYNNGSGKLNTLFTYKTPEKAQAFVTNLNKALDVFVRARTKQMDMDVANAEIRNLLKGSLGITSVKSLGKYFDGSNVITGSADNHTLKYRPVQATPNDVNTVRGVADQARRLGGLITTRSRGGKLIPDIEDGATINLMDPIKAMQRAANSVIQKEGTQAYMNRAGETLKAKIKAMGSDTWGGKDVSNMAGVDVIRDWDSIKPTKVNKWQKNDLRSMDTFVQKQMMAFSNNTRADDILEEAIGGLGERGHAIVSAIAERFNMSMAPWEEEWNRHLNPLKLLRNMNFYLTFFGSIRQFPMQAMAALNSVTANPVAGSRAMALYAPMRLALMAPKHGKEIAKKFAPIVGMKPKELEDMLFDMIRSGKYIIGGEVAELSIQEFRDLMRSDYSFWSLVKKGGLSPFVEGEKLARMVAWMTAYQRFGRRPKVSQDFAAISADADYLTMSMTSASKARWNDGLAAVMLQWASYPARFMETMFSTKLTARERMTIGAMNLVGFGTAGAIGGSLALDAADSFGKYFESEEAAYLAYFGLMKALIDYAAEATGNEPVDINTTVFGPQVLETPILSTLLSYFVTEQYDESFLEVLLGPSMGIGFQATINSAEAAKKLFVRLSSDDPSWEDGAEFGHRVLGNFKFLSDATRGYMMYTTGHDIDVKKKLRGIDKSTMDAIVRSVGFGSAQESLMWDIRVKEKSREKAIRDVANRISDLLRQQRDGIMSQDEFMAERESILMFFNDEDSKEAMRQAINKSGGMPFIYRTIREIETQDEYFNFDRARQGIVGDSNE